MNGLITAWGRILTGYTPSLSIEITRECPLRCPGCYAYGDDHLGGEVTLREVRDFKGQALVDGVMRLIDAPPSSPRLHRRRRAARPVQGAERPAPAGDRPRHPRAGRDERGPRDSPAVEQPAAVHARRLDRRPAARARCAADAGHVRPDSEAHRGPPDYGSLHDYETAGQPGGISRGIPSLLVRPEGDAEDLDEPLHAADRREPRPSD